MIIINTNNSFDNINWYKTIRRLNKNAGIITLLITFCTTILSFLISFLENRYLKTRLEYYNLEISTTSTLTNSFIYNLFRSFLTIVAIFSIIKIVKYSQTKNKFLILSSQIAGFYLFFNLIAIKGSFLEKAVFLLTIYITGLVLYFLFFHVDIITPSNKTTFNCKIIFKLYISITFIILVLCWLKFAASQYEKNRKNYKIISNNKVIVYETKDIFYVEKCEIDDNDNTLTIYINEQTIISKQDIMTIQKTFNKVKIVK